MQQQVALYTDSTQSEIGCTPPGTRQECSRMMMTMRQASFRAFVSLSAQPEALAEHEWMMRTKGRGRRKTCRLLLLLVVVVASPSSERFAAECAARRTADTSSTPSQTKQKREEERMMMRDDMAVVVDAVEDRTKMRGHSHIRNYAERK